jgi:hypothetical protein
MAKHRLTDQQSEVIADLFPARLRRLPRLAACCVSISKGGDVKQNQSVASFTRR